MSGLQKAQLGSNESIDLLNSLNKWLQPPDHDDVQSVIEDIGNLKARVVRKKREIKKAEDSINDTVDKPRSNEAKRLKNEVSTVLYDELAALEAELERSDATYRFYEYHLKMYQHALYHSRMSMKIDV